MGNVLANPNRTLLMKTTVRLQLSVMMFLQYFIWGSWFVTLGTFLTNTLKFDGAQVGLAYSTTNLAAMIAPLFVGMIADRFFSSEKVLATLHLMGAVFLYLASTQQTWGLFFGAIMAHTLCYMPTMALTNSIAFGQMKDAGKEFPGIRVLGTIGWIAAGVLIGKLHQEASSVPMLVGAGASLALALFSLTLPHTPPKSKGQRVSLGDVIGLPALRLFKDPSFSMFALGSFLVCIPLAFYYNFTNLYLTEVNISEPAYKMTFGQMSEIYFMLVMPFFFTRLGVKKMLLVGIAAWAARYFLFAYGNGGALAWMLIMGVVLHGICYDFFFVTGQIYVDRQASPEIRSAAQGLVAFLTYGAGMYVGSLISGVVLKKYTAIPPAVGHQWQTIWIIPAIGAVAILLLFAATFHEKKAVAAKSL